MFRSHVFVLQIDLARTCTHVNRLPDQAFRILRLFDGHRSLAEVLDDSPLDRDEALKVIHRLAGLGLLRLTRRASPKREHLQGNGDGRATACEEMGSWLGERGEDTVFSGLSEDLLDLDLDPTASFHDACPESAWENGCRDEGKGEMPDTPCDLAAVPSAMERSLPKAWDQRLVAAQIEEELDCVVEEILMPDPCRMTEGEEPGFSPVEEEFFDSYIPDEPDPQFESFLDELFTPGPS